MKRLLLPLLVLSTFIFQLSTPLRAAQGIKDLSLAGTTTDASTYNASGAHTFLSGASATFNAGSTLTLNGTLAGTPTGGTFSLANVTLTLPSATTALFAARASNLSDLASAATARTNLGLGTLATQNGSVSGTNTGDQTISLTGDVTASGSTGALTTTVTKLNGVALSGLATGILKNTTTTGAPSIAVAGTDYLTPAGSAASLTGLPLTTGITGTLPVGNGGTGLTAPGTNGNVLTSNGTIWTSTAPAATGVTGITGTANQITVTGTTTPTLSVPADFRTTSGTFSSLTSGRVLFASTAGLLSDAATITYSSNILGLQRNGITTTSTGLQLVNTTATTNGAQTPQYSPAIQFTGHAWNTTATAADNYLEVINELRPSAAAATPTSVLAWAYRRSTSGTGSFTDALQLSTGATNYNSLNLTGTNNVILYFNGYANINGDASGNVVLTYGTNQSLKLSSNNQTFTFARSGSYLSMTPEGTTYSLLGTGGSRFTEIYLGKTVTAAGTTGARTINDATGSVNFAAAATSLVVTNSLSYTDSIITATIATNDATAANVKVVAGTGSFTIYLGTAPTAETRVNFRLSN